MTTKPLHPTTGGVARTKDEAVAFLLANIDRLESGCWNWRGRLDPKGYGHLGFEGRSYGAHRAAWILLRGPPLSGLDLDHLCRNTACVNPDHLELVTHRENMARGTSPVAQNSAKTHCKRGHPLSGDNIYTTNGWRACKTCSVERSRINKQKRRAAQRTGAA